MLTISLRHAIGSGRSHILPNKAIHYADKCLQYRDGTWWCGVVGSWRGVRMLSNSEEARL